MQKDLVRSRNSEARQSVEREKCSELSVGLKEKYSKAFEKIKQVLVAHNFDRTAKQHQDKVKSLKKPCKDIIDKNRKSGAGNESDDDISMKNLP